MTWFHPADPVDLREREIDESQSADLRRRVASFAEDRVRPEMAAHDELEADLPQRIVAMITSNMLDAVPRSKSLCPEPLPRDSRVRPALDLAMG